MSDGEFRERMDKAGAARKSEKPAGKPSGVISRDELYTIKECASRLRIGQRSIATARRKGLPVRKIGMRKYIYGADLIDWLTKPEGEADKN